MNVHKLLITALFFISASLAFGASGSTFSITLDGGGQYDGTYPVGTPAQTNTLKPDDATGGYKRTPDGTYYSKCGAEPYGCNFLSESGAELIVDEAKTAGQEKLNRLDASHNSALDKLQLDWEAVVSGQPPVQGGAAAFVADLEMRRIQAAADLKSTATKLNQTKLKSANAAIAKVKNVTGPRVNTKPAFNYTKHAYQPLQQYAGTAAAQGVSTGSFGSATNQHAAEMLIKKAEGAFRAGYPVVAVRMYEHARVLHSYQQGQADADGYTNIVLSPDAAERFGFSGNEIIASSYYGYGIISASNELAKLDNLALLPQVQLLSFLHLQNANLARLSDNLPAFNNAIENAWAAVDYLKGFGSGIIESVYDSVTGVWQMVSHPISTLEILTTAIINYDKTLDIIVEQLSDVIDNYDNLSIEEKGQLHGKIATDIGSMFLGIGALKKTSDVLKVNSWLNRSSVFLANTAKVYGIRSHEGLKVLGEVSHALETLPGALRVQRIREGVHASKVAIIGRSMGNTQSGLTGVRNAAAHMKSKGLNPLTFESSPAAWKQFEETVKNYRDAVGNQTAMLPDDLVKTTEVFRENVAWVEKLKAEGFTVFDIGNPNNLPDASIFYEVEKRILFN